MTTEAERERIARMAWRFAGHDRHGGPFYEGAKPSDSPAMQATFAFADAILSSPPCEGGGRIAELEAEVARLTPKPNEFDHMTSAVYRDGPLTPAIYDEAIEDLCSAKIALVEGDNYGCRVCEDSGHSANGGCHHNPLLLARKWARATAIWRCYHCGYIATNDAEAKAHFGATEDEAAACLAALATPVPQSEDKECRKAGYDVIEQAIEEFWPAVRARGSNGYDALECAVARYQLATGAAAEDGCEEIVKQLLGLAHPTPQSEDR